MCWWPPQSAADTVVSGRRDFHAGDLTHDPLGGSWGRGQPGPLSGHAERSPVSEGGLGAVTPATARARCVLRDLPRYGNAALGTLEH